MKNANIISTILLPIMIGCGGNRQMDKSQSYSGKLHEIHTREYNRMIFTKSTTEKYLISILQAN